MFEEWRPVTGFEGVYEVSSLGRVRSVDRIMNVEGQERRLRSRSLKQRACSYGNYVVVLALAGSRTAARVADLMMQAFVGPAPEGQEAVHKDGDPDNNFIGNLEYGVSRDGDYYSSPNNNAKLVEQNVRDIRESKEKSIVLAGRYGVTRRTIDVIKAGKTWKHVQ